MNIIFRKAGVLLVATLITCPLFNFVLAQPEEAVPGGQTESVPEANLSPAPSVSEIEQAIADLKDISDTDKLMWIQNAIFQQDPGTSARLQKSLEEKQQELFQKAAAAPQSEESAGSPEIKTEEPAPALPAEETVSAEELKLRIDALKLGPEATVEDLREQNEIVYIIARIKDPVLRYELLDYLEAKEKQPQ